MRGCGRPEASHSAVAHLGVGLLVVLLVIERILHRRLAQPVLAQMRVETPAVVACEFAAGNRVGEGARRHEVRCEQPGIKEVGADAIRRQLKRLDAQFAKRLQRDRIAVGEAAPPIRLGPVQASQRFGVGGQVGRHAWRGRLVRVTQAVARKVGNVWVADYRTFRLSFAAEPRTEREFAARSKEIIPITTLCLPASWAPCLYVCMYVKIRRCSVFRTRVHVPGYEGMYPPPRDMLSIPWAQRYGEMYS